jgi:serine/threonine protein kinase
MIQRWIGQYQLIEVIGQGGCPPSTVQTSLGRPRWAIKVLPRQLTEDPTFLKRFRREARVLSELEASLHPAYL